MLIDTKEAARRLGVSPTRVQQLLLQNRILGATKMGDRRGVWVIEVQSNAEPVVLPPVKRR